MKSLTSRTWQNKSSNGQQFWINQPHLSKRLQTPRTRTGQHTSLATNTKQSTQLVFHTTSKQLQIQFLISLTSSVRAQIALVVLLLVPQLLLLPELVRLPFRRERAVPCRQRSEPRLRLYLLQRLQRELLLRRLPLLQELRLLVEMVASSKSEL